MRDNSSIVAGSAGQLSAVARLLLQAADDGALGHGADGQDVADVQLSCKEQQRAPTASLGLPGSTQTTALFHVRPLAINTSAATGSGTSQ